jgi:hypothetical protein
MKKHLYLTIIVVALLSLAGWTGYAREQRSSVGRQTWEYHVDPVPGTRVTIARNEIEDVARFNAAEDEQLINRRAAEGWELAAVGGVNYYFRRAK